MCLHALQFKSLYSPEDGGKNGVHGEGTDVEIILLPDAMSIVVTNMRLLKGVVDGGDDGEQPRNQGEDLVSSDFAYRVGFTSGERVHYMVRECTC